jgi:hypothetical protein
MAVILGKQCDGLAVAVQRFDVDIGGACADGAGASAARDPAFTSVTPTPIAAIAARARKRVLREHTAAHRAAELERYVAEAKGTRESLPTAMRS